jgi:hypothetical protein
MKIHVHVRRRDCRVGTFTLQWEYEVSNCTEKVEADSRTEEEE